MKNIFVCLLLIFMFTSCSVFMAANKKGVGFDEISQCKTKSCLLSKGVEPLDSKKNEGGVLVETYKVRKPTGSASRAAMHGLLDVATLGIWEVAGTPIEGSMNKEEFITIKAFYQKDNETIQHVELMQ